MQSFVKLYSPHFCRQGMDITDVGFTLILENYIALKRRELCHIRQH